MSILFGADIPSYEEQLELCRRLNAAAAARRRKTEHQPPAAKPQIIRRRPLGTRPFLIWSNPNPPRR